MRDKLNFVAPSPSIISRPYGKKYGTNKDLAAFFGVSEMTIWRWKRNPKLKTPPNAKVNGRPRNDLDAWDNWMQRQAS
jgi:hypothetical protein